MVTSPSFLDCSISKKNRITYLVHVSSIQITKNSSSSSEREVRDKQKKLYVLTMHRNKKQSNAFHTPVWEALIAFQSSV